MIISSIPVFINAFMDNFVTYVTAILAWYQMVMIWFAYCFKRMVNSKTCDIIYVYFVMIW